MTEHGMQARQPAEAPRLEARQSHRHRVVALSLVALVAGMVGMSYAAVPLYRIFCQVTGYAGTTQKATAPSTRVLERTIMVRFDANVVRELGWEFQPVERRVTLKIGENKLAFYRARNLTNGPLTGTATFNVTPEIAGGYFNKVDCFCFTEQTLKAGETIDMPVSFYIDPDIVMDPDANWIREITLSYTFFPVKKRAPGVAAKGAGKTGS